MANLELTLDDVDNALTFLDPNLPFQEWSQIGRSLYAEFGDSGLETFELWSQQGSSFKANEFKAWRKNFRGVKRTTIGSFIYMAKQAGWKPERKELSDEEKRDYAIAKAKRIADNEAKFKAEEQAQWNALQTEEQLFHSLPQITKQANIGNYLAGKMLPNAYQFNDLRRVNETIKLTNPDRSFQATSTARGLWSELGNKGKFCGFEKLADRKAKQSGNQKFASDNAKTEVGFTSIGFTEKTSRVFVGGGYANCLAGHMTTGDCWVSPIGEGHIPQIVKHLRNVHPHIEFIAAPDNDKQGLIVTKECGGKWTVPTIEGQDWWDVWHNQGNQALIEQVNNIRGFELILSNSRYLEATIKDGLNFLDSDMGTGKSFAVKNHIVANPNQKTLIISHRKALARSLKESINKDSDNAVNVEYYEDLLVNSGDSGQFLREAQCLVISVDSLHKLNGSQWDFVFVDEIEQNLTHYFADTNTNGENNLNMLNFLLKHSKVQVLADAHLGDLTYNFCAEIGLTNGVHYKNEFQIGTKKTINIFESKNHLTEFTKQQLFSGERSYIFANSKGEVKKLAIELQQEAERKHFNGKVLVVHADVKEDADVKAALIDIEAAAPSLDVMIASPTLGTGFDIPSKAHKFTSTVGILNNTVGSAEEGHQGLNRARDVDTFNVYINPALGNAPTDSEIIFQKLIEERSIDTAKILSIDPNTGEFGSRNPLFEWLYCEVKAKMNESRNDYKGRFIELAQKSGYTINFIEKNTAEAKFGQAAREQANERNNRIMLRNVQNAPVHTGDALEAMNKNSENFSHDEIVKSRAAFDLNLFDASNEELDSLYPLAKETYNEFKDHGENFERGCNDDAAICAPLNDRDLIINALTFKQGKERFINKIKKLSLITLNAETAKALDRREVNQQDKSRVNWRHQSVKRQHLSRILLSAGIDESLNYNGKTWNISDIKGQLTNWLKKPSTRDSLYKYSDVMVTDKTLEKPVQWLNNFLRSVGIPVKTVGKKRVAGKPINIYAVDGEALEAVKTLVLLRTRGIEQNMAERDTEQEQHVNTYLLQQEIAEFMFNVQDLTVGPQHVEIFERLMKNVSALRNPEITKAKLEQAFAKIAHLVMPQTDPSLPVVISNQKDQDGSLTISHESPSHNGSLQSREGESTPVYALKVLNEKGLKSGTNSHHADLKSFTDTLAAIKDKLLSQQEVDELLQVVSGAQKDKWDFEVGEHGKAFSSAYYALANITKHEAGMRLKNQWNSFTDYMSINKPVIS